MPSSKWVQVIIGEFQAGQRSQLLYKDITRELLENHFSPMSVTRADVGIGEKNEMRFPIQESIQFNNLPMIIETAGSEEQVERLTLKIKNMLPCGELLTLASYSLNDESSFDEKENDFEEEYLMLKLFLHERILWHERPLHEEILSLLQKHYLIWSIVKRGIAGFGNDQVIHKSSFFSHSLVPVVIECVGRKEVIRTLIPELRSKIQHGLMIAMPVEMIVCK